MCPPLLEMPDRQPTGRVYLILVPGERRDRQSPTEGRGADVEECEGVAKGEEQEAALPLHPFCTAAPPPSPTPTEEDNFQGGTVDGTLQRASTSSKINTWRSAASP